MSKRPTDHLMPSAKKRAQDRQGRKGDEFEDDSEEEQPGQFAKASDDVLKTRRIIKARRAGGGLVSTQASKTEDGNPAAPGEVPATAAPGSNPFAGISLLVPSKSHAPRSTQASVPTAAAPAAAELGSKDAVAAGGDTKDEAATSPEAAVVAETENAAQAGTCSVEVPTSAKPDSAAAPAETGSADKAATDATKPSEQPAATDSAATEPVPSAEASTGNAGNDGASGGFQGGFSFGSNLAKSVGSGFGALAGAAGSGSGLSFSAQSTTSSNGGVGGSLFGSKPAFAFGSSGAGSGATAAQSVFGGSTTGAVPESAANKSPLLSVDAPVETGEEGERTVFSGEGTLFGFDAGGWKERGRGELRVKVGQSGQARIIMRQRGNLRLLLNANLWEDMAVNIMDGALGATFAVQNAAAPPQSADGKESTEASDGAPPKTSTNAKSELGTFAFRVKNKQALEEFTTAVNHYKKVEAVAVTGDTNA